MALFRSAKATSRLGCFGKVPGYGDFVSINADSDDATALTAWLESGVAAGAAAGTAAHDQYLQYVWQPPGSKRCLMGVLWPSADAAGRRFPFTLFVSHPAQALEALGPRALIAAEAAWQRFHVVHGRIRQMSQLEAVRTELQGVGVPVLPDARAVNSAYVNRVQPSGADNWNAVALGLQLSDLIHNAEGLRSAGGLPDFAMRLRLHSRHDPVAEAVSWMHVLLDNLGARSIDAALFVRVSLSDGAGLFVFRRDLDAADLPYMLVPAAGSRQAADVGFREAPANAQDRASLEAFGRKWSAAPASLALLLEIGAQGWSPGEVDTAEVDPSMRSFTGAGEAQAAPRLEPVSDDSWVTDDDEITGEVVLGTQTSDPITGPFALEDAETLAGAPRPPELTAALAEMDAVEEITSDAEVPEAVGLEARLREMVTGEMLPGRMVRVNAPSADDGAAELFVYIDDEGAAATAATPDAGLDEVRRCIAVHEEARSLLEALGRAHRQTEDELERLIVAACARTGRPGRQAEPTPIERR